MSISFGYTVVWVPDVKSTMDFYERAFGLTRRFVQKSGPTVWGEMETGGTALAFASESEAKRIISGGFYPNRPDEAPPLIQLSMVTDDVAAAYAKALAAGATPQAAPQTMPWGQTVARVRDLNGLLVSFATPFKR